MDDKKFSLSYKKEKPFEFSQKYKGVLKDDTDYHVIIEGGFAILIETEFVESIGDIKYPWTYIFEVR